jgi:hypothetical protein
MGDRPSYRFAAPPYVPMPGRADHDQMLFMCARA